jgi:hypothetical protein
VPPVQYALVPTDVAGQRLAADPEIGLSLYKVNGPLVVLTRVDGVDSDTWGGRYVSYRRFDCHGGHLTVTLASDLKLFAVPNRIAVRQFGRLTTTIHLDPRTTPQSPLVVRIPLRPRRGVCRVSFVAAFTSVPATHEPGSTDRRRLAAHYQSFVYSP